MGKPPADKGKSQSRQPVTENSVPDRGKLPIAAATDPKVGTGGKRTNDARLTELEVENRHTQRRLLELEAREGRLRALEVSVAELKQPAINWKKLIAPIGIITGLAISLYKTARSWHFWSSSD